MNFHRITLAFKLAGIALGLAFLAQVMLVQAEHLGLLDHDALHAACASDTQDSKNIPTEGCHTLCVQSPYFTSNTSVSIGHFFQSHCSFIVHDEVAPDGPVKAIDHPPQLS